MAQLNAAQRKWLETLGVNMAVATAAQPQAELATASSANDIPEAPPSRSSSGDDAPQAAPPAAPPSGDGWSIDPSGGDVPTAAPDLLKMRKPNVLDPLGTGVPIPSLDPSYMLEQSKKAKAAAEAKLKEYEKALKDLKSYVEGLPRDELLRSNYAKVITDIRKKYPDLADLAKWVRETESEVPDLKGKLPNKTALIDTVQSVLEKNGVAMSWSMSTGRDLASVAAERLLAGYMSQLPAGVSIDISGGSVKLTKEGAALSVKTPVGQVDAKADKGGAQVSLKHNDYSIEVTNEGWKEFDPKLRGQWQRISDEATTVIQLQADRDKAKLEYESKSKEGGDLAAQLKADFDKREAEFTLAWSKLKEKVDATAKASEQAISASITYLKKDKNDKDALKVGAEVEVDFKAMQGKLKAYYASPTLEAVLNVTASAEKVTAKLELKAVKSGTVVTTNFEKSLDETKAAIDIAVGKTTVGVQLTKKLEDISAKLKVVHESKDLKLAAELEKTLKEVRGSLELEIKKGKTTAKVGIEGSSEGKVGGKAQIDIALGEGRYFGGAGGTLSFGANVSTSGYKFEVSFSLGTPAEPGGLQDLFSTADRQIQELYRLAADADIRSMDDINAVNQKMKNVMAEVDAAAKKAKSLKTKREITASFGFSIEGDWPAGGKAAPPAAMFKVQINF